MDELFAKRRGLVDEKISNINDLKTLFVLFHNEQRDNGSLESFYKINGKNIEAFCFSKIGYRDLMPIDHDVRYTEPQIFSFFELFYKYIGYGDEIFGKTEKYLYRTSANKILNNYSSGWELKEDGKIYELVNEGIDTLLEQKYEGIILEQHVNDIELAKKKFLEYGATLDDKKQALLLLAGALEYYRRSDMKTLLNSKDEGDLFNILNTYQLRHNRPDQKTNYDKEIYYPWMFYMFLSTFDAFAKLKERQK